MIGRLLTTICLVRGCDGALPDCTVSELRARVPSLLLDHVRWVSYWYSRPVGRDSIALIWNLESGGYCIQAWNQCAVLDTLTEDLFGTVGERQYTNAPSELNKWAAAILQPRSSSPPRPRAVDPSQRSSVRAGGIADPVGAPGIAAPRSRDFELSTCAAPVSAVTPLIPRAVLERQRSTKGASIVAAVLAQGLAENGHSVLVPWVGRADEAVFLVIRSPSGVTRLMFAGSRGNDWWFFRPGTEAGLGGSVDRVAKKVVASPMAVIRGTVVAWTKN